MVPNIRAHGPVSSGYASTSSLTTPFRSSPAIISYPRRIRTQAILGGALSHSLTLASSLPPEVAEQELSLFSGSTVAFLLILFSEIGDKTFFIAALLAARKSPSAVFVGTFAALAVMTVISVLIGEAFHYADAILPFTFGKTELPLDDIAAAVLLLYFGVSTLQDAVSMDDSKADEEQQEAEKAIELASSGKPGSLEDALSTSALLSSIFVLVFVAEWGDKSFFSTVALAAASSPVGVIVGSVAAHGVATLIAVLGGSLIASNLSEKAVAYIGGFLFLAFAASTTVDIVSKVIS